VTWFRVDDGFWRHRKVRRLGKDRVPAVGLWLLAGNWSADQLTDGFVPLEQVETWDPRRRLAEKLAKAGLWTVTTVDGEAGYQFHQWAEHQPIRDEVLDRRRKRQEAGRLGGLRSGQSRRTKPEPTAEANASATAQANGQAEPKQNRTPSRPDPSLSGHLGEGEVTTPRARGNNPPPPKCPDHEHVDGDPGPCRACGDARRARAEWDAAAVRRAAEQRAAEARQRAEIRAAAIAACRLCDDGGYRGRVLCDHDPASADRAARGSAEVRAALDRRDTA
jgi:hypothetical protein